MTYIMKLPWGVHAGKTVDQVPTKYLEWMLTQGWVWAQLREEIKHEVGIRPDRKVTHGRH